MTIAQTILQQLGGNRFLAMTGAKDLVDTGRGLQMTVARRKVRVTLTAVDLYDVEFFKINRKTFKAVTTCLLPGVYASDLRREFTTATGLEVSL